MVQSDIPHTTVILAMSADGKIADFNRSPARFGSAFDRAHLERQIAAADAVLFGADTLRAYGTTVMISDPQLIQQRMEKSQPSQPIHIVISSSGKLNPDIRFFQQPVKRWLLTTSQGANFWQGHPEFNQLLTTETSAKKIELVPAWKHLSALGIASLAVLGGSKLVASLCKFDLIDEFWLKICPLIFGGDTAPSPGGGEVFLSDVAPKLHLLETYTIEQEVFLHYRREREIGHP